MCVLYIIIDNLKKKTVLTDSHIETPSTPSTSKSSMEDIGKEKLISKTPNEQPCQPKLAQFPKNIHKRAFTTNIYVQYEWAEYCTNNDAVFCFCCRHFSGSFLHKGL